MSSCVHHADEAEIEGRQGARDAFSPLTPCRQPRIARAFRAQSQPRPRLQRLVTCRDQLIHAWRVDQDTPVLKLEGHTLTVTGLDVCDKEGAVASGERAALSYQAAVAGSFLVTRFPAGILLSQCAGARGSSPRFDHAVVCQRFGPVLIRFHSPYPLPQGSRDYTVRVWDIATGAQRDVRSVSRNVVTFIRCESCDAQRALV